MRIKEILLWRLGLVHSLQSRRVAQQTRCYRRGMLLCNCQLARIYPADSLWCVGRLLVSPVSLTLLFKPCPRNECDIDSRNICLIIGAIQIKNSHDGQVTKH